MKTRIDQHILDRWRSLRFHSDISKILERVRKKKIKANRHQISIAINYGFAEQELIDVISEYYNSM